jgi:hypothetical protein
MKRILISLTLGTSIALGGLFGTAAPALAAPATSTHQSTHAFQAKKHWIGRTVRAGSFCAARNHNWYGYSSKHKLMKCKTTSYDARLRWRAV